MQHNAGAKPTQVLSKFGKLVPPPGEGAAFVVKRSLPKIASLYKCAVALAARPRDAFHCWPMCTHQHLSHTMVSSMPVKSLMS